jgi:hypothetical protein
MHHLGRALTGTPPAIGPVAGKNSPFYEHLAAQADDHRHELSGADWQGNDPLVARRALAGVLFHLLGFWPPARELAEALRALDEGEVRPLLRPGGGKGGGGTRGRQGSAYSLDQLRLKAHAHVAFRRGLGASEEAARAAVAEAFGVTPEALRQWVKRGLLDRPTHRRERDHARHQGEHCRRIGPDPTSDWRDEGLRKLALAFFGDAALAEDGRTYQATQRQ